MHLYASVRYLYIPGLYSATLARAQEKREVGFKNWNLQVGKDQTCTDVVEKMIHKRDEAFSKLLNISYQYDLCCTLFNHQPLVQYHDHILKANPREMTV